MNLTCYKTIDELKQFDLWRGNLLNLKVSRLAM